MLEVKGSGCTAFYECQVSYWSAFLECHFSYWSEKVWFLLRSVDFFVWFFWPIWDVAFEKFWPIGDLAFKKCTTAAPKKNIYPCALRGHIITHFHLARPPYDLIFNPFHPGYYQELLMCSNWTNLPVWFSISQPFLIFRFDCPFFRTLAWLQRCKRRKGVTMTVVSGVLSTSFSSLNPQCLQLAFSTVSWIVLSPSRVSFNTCKFVSNK